MNISVFFLFFDYNQKKLNKYDDDDDRHVAMMYVIV
jgi:hypothetical protein